MNAQIQGYSVGATVADFTVTDVHGNTHTLSDWTNAGKWVVLDFFFTTCPPCQGTVPYFSELHEKYGCNAGDLACISIDTGDSDAEVLAFEATYSSQGGFQPAPAVSGLDGGGNAVIGMFQPAAYPTYCLIGPDMKLKNGDIWPISSVASFESAFTTAGFNPTQMACGGLNVEEIIALNEFAVYPNPAAQSTTVAFSLETNEEVAVVVYNLLGAEVSTQTFDGTYGSNAFTLNTSELANGQYLVKVFAGNKTAQATLSVQK
jgi:thiol-disulfide isomerase/thioredoxin